MENSEPAIVDLIVNIKNKHLWKETRDRRITED